MLIDIEAVFSKQQYQKWYSCIPQRFSCRHFKPELNTEIRSALCDFLCSFSMNGIKLDLIEVSELSINKFLFKIPFFIKSPYYILIRADKSIENPNLYAGFIGEALILEAHSLGLSSCWCGMLSTFSSKEFLQDDEILCGVIAIGESDSNIRKTTNKKQLNKICVNDPYKWGDSWAFNVAEAVRNCPSALNSQPWLFSYANKTLAIKMNSLNSLEAGISILHALCALQETSFNITISSEKYIFIQEI